jgi:hypothetical protein
MDWMVRFAQKTCPDSEKRAVIPAVICRNMAGILAMLAFLEVHIGSCYVGPHNVMYERSAQ